METTEILIYVCIAGCVVTLVDSGKAFWQWRQLGKNHSVPIRDAPTESDLVEIKGRVRPHDTTLESPYFGEECVVYEYETKRKCGTGWVTRSHSNRG